MRQNSTKQRIREAMARLLEGQSYQTDDRWTVMNGVREAGVSMTTANRYPVVLEQFRQAIGDLREAKMVKWDGNEEKSGRHCHMLAQQT